MDENEILIALNMPIQQKIKVQSLLKWLNLILYPSKHDDRHQNYFDTMHSDWDIDERKFFCNGGLNLRIGEVPKNNRVASFWFLKSTPRRYRKSKKNFVRTVLQGSPKIWGLSTGLYLSHTTLRKTSTFPEKRYYSKFNRTGVCCPTGAFLFATSWTYGPSARHREMDVTQN